MLVLTALWALSVVPMAVDIPVSQDTLEVRKVVYECVCRSLVLVLTAPWALSVVPMAVDIPVSQDTLEVRKVL